MIEWIMTWIKLLQNMEPELAPPCPALLLMHHYKTSWSNKGYFVWIPIFFLYTLFNLDLHRCFNPHSPLTTESSWLEWADSTACILSQQILQRNPQRVTHLPQLSSNLSSSLTNAAPKTWSITSFPLTQCQCNRHKPVGFALWIYSICSWGWGLSVYL